MEPTVYSLLALHGVSGAEGSSAKGHALIAGWRTSDGSYRPSSQVQVGTWVTALAVLLSSVHEGHDGATAKSVDWLLDTRGAESRPLARAFNFFHLTKVPLDLSHTGWPWLPGTSSWIEPTCQTLLALKTAARNYRSYHLLSRIQEAETMVLSRRCRDGGWNAGTPYSLSYDEELPSYPESTGLALLGLQGRHTQDLPRAVKVAEILHAKTNASLGRAWLAIALRLYGRDLASPVDDGSRCKDILLSALQALGHPQGNYHLLQTSLQPGAVA
jgi:hypothetical protein